MLFCGKLWTWKNPFSYFFFPKKQWVQGSMCIQNLARNAKWESMGEDQIWRRLGPSKLETRTEEGKRPAEPSPGADFHTSQERGNWRVFTSLGYQPCLWKTPWIKSTEHLKSCSKHSNLLKEDHGPVGRELHKAIVKRLMWWGCHSILITRTFLE